MPTCCSCAKANPLVIVCNALNCCRYAHVLEALEKAGFLMASEMPQYLKVGWYRCMRLVPLHEACWRMPACNAAGERPLTDRQVYMCLMLSGTVAQAAAPAAVLCCSCLAALQERAEADGEERPTKPDRKTCDRIVARGREEGRLQVWSTSQAHAPLRPGCTGLAPAFGSVWANAATKGRRSLSALQQTLTINRHLLPGRS